MYFRGHLCAIIDQKLQTPELQLGQAVPIAALLPSAPIPLFVAHSGHSPQAGHSITSCSCRVLLMEAECSAAMP